MPTMTHNKIDFSLKYKVADISLAAWGRKENQVGRSRNARINGPSGRIRN